MLSQVCDISWSKSCISSGLPLWSSSPSCACYRLITGKMWVHYHSWRGCRFHTMWRVSWLAERLLVSQGNCCMDLVTGRWGDTIYLRGYSVPEYIAVLVNYITLAIYRL
jgi:hypothetical protein